MATEYGLGEHLGNLAFHVEVLSRRQDELADELVKIRGSGVSVEDRVRRENAAFRSYVSDVSERLQSAESQVENVVEDVSDVARERAVEIRDGSVAVRFDEFEVPEAGFETASLRER